MALLEVENIELSFAGLKVLRGVSLSLEKGELKAVIGPNGAGKTSLFNCISGFYRPSSGDIRFDGQSILGHPPHDIAERGVARSFQNIALFSHLTVLENLQVGRHNRFASRWWQDLFFSAKTRSEEVRHRQRVEEVIELLHLERFRRMPTGILPYGVLKRVELGRALCMEPRVLLLDEPAAGLNQEGTEDMARYILDIKEELGISMILIEHDLRFVMDLADRIVALDFGKQIAEGPPAEISKHPSVIEAYAGVASAEGAAS